jgi:hypothetical protein
MLAFLVHVLHAVADLPQSPEDFIKEANQEADALLLMHAHNELPTSLSQLEAVVLLLCPTFLLVRVVLLRRGRAHVVSSPSSCTSRREGR